jgi:hypothetical protein
MTLEDALATLDFVSARNAEDAVLLLETPFINNANYKPSVTRFSDGSWRVFYSALEPETAEQERAHWCRKNAQSNPTAVQRFHYRELRCRLDGHGYDLRPKREDWPFLTGDETYPPCNALAAEARTNGAHAMLCPSARRPKGTTTPVFAREALSQPVILNLVVLQIEADGRVEILRPR